MIFAKPVRRKVEAPGGIITPTPTYCWGQFATNGRGNRNTGGPSLSLTGGTPVGENLQGVVRSNSDVGRDENHLWIYVRLFLPNEVTENPGFTNNFGWFCKMIAANTNSLDSRIYRFQSWPYWELRMEIWDRLRYTDPYPRVNLVDLAPGAPGFQDAVMIHEARVDTDYVKTWLSWNGSTWHTELSETGLGIEVFRANEDLCFNAWRREEVGTDPPNPQLVECCVREGGAYSEAENLQILQNGMEASFGI